jgi:hypothetical protein
MFEPPPARQRINIAVLLGMLAAFFTHMSVVFDPAPPDAALILRGTHAALVGQDPYLVVPGLVYPLPGLLAMAPWSLLPESSASVIFIFVSASAFAWVLMSQGYASLLCFFSPGMLFAAQVAQWSPLFAAAFAIAPLGVFLIVKPHVGLATFCARPSWWAVVGAVGCTLVAFALQPTWLADWGASMARSQVHLGLGGRQYVYAAPISLPGGFLVLAALTRWRRPEARLLVVLAVVPQSLHLYEIVPLAVVPRGWREATLYLVGAHLTWWVLKHMRPWSAYPYYLLASGTLYTLLVFLPLTAMVIRRPNVGALPPWLEIRVAGWPTWLRGSAVRSESATSAS